MAKPVQITPISNIEINKKTFIIFTDFITMKKHSTLEFQFNKAPFY